MAWSEQETREVAKALAVACELTGTVLSDAARAFVIADLQSRPAKEVVNALGRLSRECTGRLTLAAITKALDVVDRKALSDARAARSVYLTHLRGCALVERIAWDEQDPESVRRALEAKGYRFGPPGEKPKALPHWSETDADD